MSEYHNPKRDGFRRVIWSTILDLHDATAMEIADELKRRVEVIRPRLTELIELGEIQDTGDKRNGGKRGPRERVFRVVDKPREDVEAACDWR